MYLKILKPLYKLNIKLQSNEATIGILIPELILMEHKLKKIKNLTISGEKLCNLLIDQIKERFEFELKSMFYRVKLFKLNFRNFKS